MTEFIAEIGSNHNGDLARAVALIELAAVTGCTGVKFQFFEMARLYAPEALAAKPELLSHGQALDLPERWLSVLAYRAHANGLTFGLSVFHRGDARRVAPLVDFLKISSYSLHDAPLINDALATKKRVILSTGMATMGEITRAVSLTAGVRNLELMHCVSGYPTPQGQCNLGAIGRLASVFDCPVGWSDHTVSPHVLQRAALKWKASTIEAHLDLDGDGAEYHGGHCWLGGELRPAIAQILRGDVLDGTGEKEPQPCEVDEIEWRADPEDGRRPSKRYRAALLSAK